MNSYKELPINAKIIDKKIEWTNKQSNCTSILNLKSIVIKVAYLEKDVTFTLFHEKIEIKNVITRSRALNYAQNNKNYMLI